MSSFELEDFYQFNNLENMNNSQFLSINWTNFKSAIVSGLIVVALSVILAVLTYILGIGDIYKLDAHTLINTGVMAGVVAIASLLKSFFTTDTGSFAGIVQVK